MKAYELIADKDKWAKHTFAIDKEGCSVRPESPDACKWCMYGAVMNLNRVLNYNKVVSKLMVSIGRLYGNKWHSPSSFNDDESTTHEMVVTVLKDADL